ncbi:helix-turn-helix domain-containing protein [Chthonobacter albigriseus]|uniref:helix-turn-helix domain-containing protein n=1 Tax=Chthonobacter albigriseus TaxID=1683161 RepID=UPI0015EE7551|nr:helix-turn-helix domain-containing protein [Chthonobacter albigriseus]
MAITADEFSRKYLTEEQRQHAKSLAQDLVAEVRTMQELRKWLELTQTEVAGRLGKNQVSVAQLERRIDPKVSTLREYIEAMGGRLDLVVRFDDRPPVLLAMPDEEREPDRPADTAAE